MNQVTSTASLLDLQHYRSDFSQRGNISLSCRIVLWLGQATKTFISNTQIRLFLAVSFITLFPLVLIGPSILGGPSSITVTNRFIFVTWPGLLALATTIFAWQAAKHLSDSALLFTSLLKDGYSCKADEWRKVFSTRPQVLMALVVGSSGAISGFIIVRQLDVGLATSILGAFSVLVSGFMGGLGFYMGALSPVLTLAVSRCDVDLHPFTPATTPAIREIAWNHGKIVFKGVVVGVVLSSPLLYLISQYTVASLRLLFILAIVPAWLVVFSVFGLVQYHLYKVIAKTKLQTRSHLHVLIKSAYEQLDQANGNAAERLQHLVELDKLVHASDRFAIDARVVIQAISSLITAVIPLVLESLIRR